MRVILQITLIVSRQMPSVCWFVIGPIFGHKWTNVRAPRFSYSILFEFTVGTRSLCTMYDSEIPFSE